MIPSAITLCAALYLAACILVFGQRFAGYSHLQRTISELGEIGAPDQHAVALWVFLPVGLALLLVAWLLRSTSEAAAALALCMAVGYMVAVAFPCDPGSPVSGSARQSVHNLGGAVQYLGGGAALLTLGQAPGSGFLRISGLMVLGATVLLTVLPTNSFRGLVQRVAETGLFAALIVVSAKQ